MFYGLVKHDNKVFFKINNKLEGCPKQYNDILYELLSETIVANKVVNLFNDIINKKLCVQDLIDFNMDQHITWETIKLAIEVSKSYRK